MYTITRLLTGLRAATGHACAISQSTPRHVQMNFCLRHSSSRFPHDGDRFNEPPDDGLDEDSRGFPRSEFRTFAPPHRQSYNKPSGSRFNRPRSWEEGDRVPRIRRPYRPQSQIDWDDDYEDRDRKFSFQRGRDMDFGARPTYGTDTLGANLKSHDWSSKQLGAVEKNFYVEHPVVEQMSEEEVEAFYQSHDITVAKSERIKPVLDFRHANFPDQINRYVSDLPWVAPTPVQSLGWPIALSGKNMVAIAQTGSGKTLGFVLPALVHIKHQRQVARGEGPVVLVLAPTRELTQQIKSVCREFGRLMGIQSTAIFGGQSKMVQARQLASGPEIIVATPGRLLDFLETEVTSLERTTYLVLDEADRMLDMGFEPQIRKILSQIRPDRQLLLWSATWPEEIQQLAHDFLGKDFTQVNIGSAQLVANPNIQQDILVCDRRAKFSLLRKELEEGPEEAAKTLVFVQTKSHADILTRQLRKCGFFALAIHGDKSQSVRDKTMDSFKRGEVEILVATDVASRGLDVDDIELVVNFDYPNTADDYIHRIGRTARGHKTGRALSFVTEDDASKAKDLISVLENASQNVPIELRDLADLHRKLSRSKGSKSRPPFKGGFHRRSPPFRHHRERW